MENDNKKQVICFNSILERIKNLDCSIIEFKSKIEKLQEEICTKEFDDAQENDEEQCLDEMESELALLKIMEEGLLEKIAPSESEGES